MTDRDTVFYLSFYNFKVGSFIANLNLQNIDSAGNTF